MSQETNIPLDPAAVGLMASIVAKSLAQYNNKNPQANLASEAAIREISEAVAVDMITAVAHLAGQVASMGGAPTQPQSPPANKRAANAYAQAQKAYRGGDYGYTDTSNPRPNPFTPYADPEEK